MTNIFVGRYGSDSGTILEDGSIRQNYQGWMEPDNKEWIAFIDMGGKATFFLDRDPATGAVR